MHTIKIVTYNIHKGFSANSRRFILPYVKESLAKIDADIVCLQEIQGVNLKHSCTVVGWPEEPQYIFLAGKLWPYVIYGKNAVYSHGHHGNGVLSKYPILYWENHDVAIYRTASRSLLHTVLTIPGLVQPLHVICVHFGLLRAERKQQFFSLQQRIQAHVPSNVPLIIAGDFNDWWREADGYLNSLALQDVFRVLNGCYARSFPAWQPAVTIDRIYYRGLRPEVCQCLKGAPWNKLSDHLPLYAEFSC